MKKNKIVITGGAGFVGTNLIKLLLKKTKYNIISIDNYSSGFKKNHIKSKRIKYIKSDTKNIFQILKTPKEINSIFHFGEFARIYQSFLKMKECLNSNSIGSNAVFNYCLQNKIKLIYSATSASLGHKGEDKNLSPYAYTKAKNLELLENLKKWFNFKYEVVYFYNVYGPHQICRGKMATVIGIFEEHYKLKKPLPVVKPGKQTRRFTHIHDTVDTCYIAHRNSYSILRVAKMFKTKISFLAKRPGERYASALTDMNLSNKVYKYFGKNDLKSYINKIISNRY